MLDGSVPSMSEGRDYRVTAEIPEVVDDSIAVYFGAVGEDLLMSVGSTAPSGDPALDDPRGDSLVIVNHAGEVVKVIAQHGTSSKPAYIVDALVSEDFLVWVETPQANYEAMPWKMYSYNLKSGDEEKIASYEDFGIEYPPWTSEKGLRPQVIGQSVYFVAVDHLDAKRGIRDRSVYQVPIRGGTDPELVVPAAGEVYSYKETVLDVEIGKSLYTWDPLAGTKGKVPGSKLDASCGSFSNEDVRVSCSDGVLIIDSSTYGDFKIETGGEDVGYLNATNRWVSFSTLDQAYVLDLRRGRLMKMPGSSNSGIGRFAGDELMYVKQDGAGGTSPLISLLPSS